MSRIYLDYNASTPLDPHVLKAFIQELSEEEGNPSSIHFHGQQNRRKLDNCRQTIARFFQVKPHEIFFTSGGTEGAAILLQGILLQNPKGHVISSQSEHACVFQTLKEFEKRGSSVTFLPTHEWGAVRAEQVEKAILPNTCLITLMAANNETGVMTDLPAVAAIAQKANIPLIVDGVAWLGKETSKIPAGVSAMFFSGHKIYAPKGIGFCICRQNLKLTPLLIGGGQEYGRRSGTENLAGIMALAEAIRIIEQDQEVIVKKMSDLRDHLEQQLLMHIPHVVVNGLAPRISNTTNLAFLGIDGESLLINLDREGVSASHGSACASGALEPSRILLGMGIPLSHVRSSLRFSLGRMTTQEEIDQAIQIIIKQVKHLHQLKRT